MIDTSLNIQLDDNILKSYLDSLINKFFKILPIIENDEESINAYLESLQSELTGLQDLIAEFGDDPAFVSLLAVLAWLIRYAGGGDADESVPYKRIRREVFHAISICKKIREQYLSNPEVV